MVANLDVVSFLIVCGIVGVVMSTAVKNPLFGFIGGVFNLLWWGFLIIGNVTITQDIIQQACTSTSCVTIDTTRNLLTFWPSVNNALPVGGMLGLFMIALSFLFLWWVTQ